MQKVGIFQAYASSKGPDQPANMGCLIKVYLHVVWLFKQCEVDQSADAILYGSDNAGVAVQCMLKLNLCYSNMMTNFQRP